MALWYIAGLWFSTVWSSLTVAESNFHALLLYYIYIRGSVRGVYAPCSLCHFTPFSLLPSIFWRLLLFTNFHCSFLISLCSPLLFNFLSCSLIISLAPCSSSQFFVAPCSLFQIFVLPAPRLRFPGFLLPSLYEAMLLAPLGLKGHSPCSLITPNGGSLIACSVPVA